MPVAVVVSLLLPLLFLWPSPGFGDELRTPSPPPQPTCDCQHFDQGLAAAQAIFASRQEDVEMPLTPVMHDRYRAQVDATYARATCLVACADVPEKERNRARMLLCESGFKDASLGVPEWRARLAVIVETTTRCLEIEPEHRGCQLFHASSRGILARGSWNPLNIRLPLQLMAEFHSARGGAAPGRDHEDGAATRGEASMLLKVPRFAGGDPAAGRQLIEDARSAPHFTCRLANRLVLAEALGRAGELEAARNELRTIVEGGLPACGKQRYENGVSIEEAQRCLNRFAEAPNDDPGWDLDCRRP